jgi:hypothetical protein
MVKGTETLTEDHINQHLCRGNAVSVIFPKYTTSQYISITSFDVFMV